MDRLNQLRGAAGGSRDSTLDTSSPPSEAFMTANESSSKYFSLSEVDSTFDISPIKDISLASSSVDAEKTISESGQLISNLSPIGKKSDFDTYKIGKQIEAANILSGGVDIFDDNDNSYDGDELVIDDNAEIEDKSNPELKLADSQFKNDNLTEATLVEGDTGPSKNTEVILQIDGKNADAIDIGNGLYLYRKEGQEELAAVQIIDDQISDQNQPSFKFLKVRENNEGNLEVYEEIQIEVPKEVPVKEQKVPAKNVSHVPIKDITKVMSDPSSNKIAERKMKAQNITKPIKPVEKPETELKKEVQSECKSDSNKKMKFSESRKSPVIGSFTPMTFHSTPNKEGIPLTKTMVDLQLHPNRHSDNVKKTIEVHTDSIKQRSLETPTKQAKDLFDNKDKQIEIEKDVMEKKQDLLSSKHEDKDNKDVDNKIEIEEKKKGDQSVIEEPCKTSEINNEKTEATETLPKEEDKVDKENSSANMTIDSSNKVVKKIDFNADINPKVAEDIKNSGECKTSEIELNEENRRSLDSVEVLNKNKSVERSDPKDSELDQKQQSEAKHLQFTEDKVKQLQLTEEKPKQILLTDEKPNQIQFNDENSKQTQVTEQTSKQIELADDNTKHINVPDDKSKQIPLTDNKPKQTQLTEDKAKEIPKSDKCVDKKLDPINQQEDYKSISTPAAKKDIEINNEISKKNNVVVESFIDKTVQEEANKPIEKETTPEPETDSKDQAKKQSNSASSTQDNVNISVPNVESKPNDSESSTKKDIGNIHFKTEPVKASQIIQADKVPGQNTEADKKEMKGLKESKADSEQKQSSEEIKDTKLTIPLQVDVKNAVAKPSNKPTSAMVSSSASNIIPKCSEPFKNISKIQTFNARDEKKEIRTVESKQDMKHREIVQTTTRTNLQSKNDTADKAAPKLAANSDQKPINNNHAPVPFGKWTDVNRQAFLNKIKESKVPTNSSNGKQIKNSNDLNRRDVLKKIDSQRQAQELANMSKLPVKKETAFASKTSAPQDNKPIVKTEIPILKNNSIAAKKITKQEPVPKHQTVTTDTLDTNVKKEKIQRKEINNQDLIDKTIEGIINRAVPVKSSQEEGNQTSTKDLSSVPKCSELPPPQPQIEKTNTHSLDDIEMKMNELHGIPFIERPPHELPHVPKPAKKSLTKTELLKAPAHEPTMIPNLVPFVGKIQKNVKENVIDVDSEEEIIEHEPITGDMDLIKNDTVTFPISETSSLPETVTLISADSSKKETIITEKDFDKFVRRNSINYENCITVSFDSKETHNVVQTIIQKDSGSKTYSKIDVPSDTKLTLPLKQEKFSQNSLSTPVHSITKFGNLSTEDDLNKNYQSKVKMAYQTAMTAKRQLERPITIIEDRPVKVVYMDSNAEFISTQLNVQGQELSPAKKLSPNNDLIAIQTSDSLDSDTLDSIDEGKMLDETKVKTKHQRKQVLTPVETPELELIAPDDLGLEVSPKKKRRTEEKFEKQIKALVPKKSYLLGRGKTTDESPTKPFDLSKNLQKESPTQEGPVVSHKNTASAIDSLVKAAELLETQSANITTKSTDMPATPESQQTPPAKRGRGRPRKYPLPEGSTDKTKIPSPQKKPRLIDAKVAKNKDTDDDDDDDSTDDEMIKENWTMGKINENILCPICNKLFRSENVVFKHVKHCTGPSPSRSDSDNKSPRRLRDSQESETKSFESKSDDMDIESETSHKDVRKKRKSRDASKTLNEKDDIIVIEDTPVKQKRDENKSIESRKTINKNKGPDKTSSLVCEFCGKTFRQLSYLVNHKLQHGKDDIKRNEDESIKTSQSVFSCEVCKKEFRKLHHLVQHRIIHNPSNATGKQSRKSSSEQSDHKTSKDQSTSKQNEDPSAGFRCEPCDKSFRKLHHLVEHRETHDGINRQKTTSNVQPNVEKLTPPPQCDICKKTFRKLHHLIEHKEQHLETLSEKSDDKSIKSSLSTKDIIHECSLCYMVFPNEHSLNKHTVFCQRKKRQSATKQQKQSEEGEKSEGDKEVIKPNENVLENDDDVTIVMEELPVEDKSVEQENVDKLLKPHIEEKDLVVASSIKPVELNQPLPTESLQSEHVPEKVENKTIIGKPEMKTKVEGDIPNLPVKVKKAEDKERKPKIQDTPKKKTPLKDKVAPTVTKRRKPNLPLPEINDKEPAESSDDDEIRYMINPDYKFKDDEGKLFMKVRANKRNSLQIERPNSKDLVKRRISLQHPPKVPRLKPKPIPNKVLNTRAATNSKTVTKAPKPEPVLSTDSDDSDVKYSFPEPPSEKALPSKVLPGKSSREPVTKTQRKSLAEKRKSLSSIAKRKSLGKAVGVKHKVKASPLKQVRKRIAEVEHKCDCGQLFSSAALLSRHTTLAHTPPRIRRRRSPAPEISTKTIIKPAPRKSSVAPKAKPTADSRKSSIKSDVSNPNPQPKQPSTKRKSSINKNEAKTPNENRKSPKSSEKTETVKSATSNVKLRRYAAHKGVPVPEKMRKVMEKSKK